MATRRLYRHNPTVEDALEELVDVYGVGDMKSVEYTLDDDKTYAGFVITQKQYGQSRYSFTVDKASKTVNMCGHFAHYGDRVILRRYKLENGETELVAFLPDEAANRGRVVCYVFIGQHSEADLGFYNRGKLEPKDTPEAKRMLAELAGLGYNLRVVTRLTRPFGEWAY